MRFKPTPNLINKEEYAVTPIWTEKSIIKLIKYGIYIGHSYKNTNYYNSWMVLGVRQGIHLLNLLKFQYMFRSALFVIDKIVRAAGPIWFVNLDKIVEKYTRKYATLCGEYGITENWNYGFLTNYRMTKRRKTFKHPIVWRKKDKLLESNFKNWALTRKSWPRLLFVSNVKESYRACVEADRLQLPTIGIVDSDAPTLFVDIAIPGNDEGVYPTIYYNSMVSMFILYKKFNFIYQWYLGARSKIKIKKQDLFSSPLSITFKSIELYPMRQLWQDAKRDEVVKRKRTKEFGMESSTKFFNFYSLITKPKKVDRRKRWIRSWLPRQTLLPSLFKKFFYFSNRFFKWKRVWHPKLKVKKIKAIRYLNQLKWLYATRGIAFRGYTKMIYRVRKDVGNFRKMFRKFRIPIRGLWDSKKKFKKFYYSRLFKPFKNIDPILRTFIRATSTKKITRKKLRKFIWRVMRSLVRSRKAWKRLIKLLKKDPVWGAAAWKVFKPMWKMHKYLHIKAANLNILNRWSKKLYLLNKWIEKKHKSRILWGSRHDFRRRKTNAYDRITPRHLRYVKSRKYKHYSKKIKTNYKNPNRQKHLKAYNIHHTPTKPNYKKVNYQNKISLSSTTNSLAYTRKYDYKFTKSNFKSKKFNFKYKKGNFQTKKFKPHYKKFNPRYKKYKRFHWNRRIRGYFNLHYVFRNLKKDRIKAWIMSKWPTLNEKAKKIFLTPWNPYKLLKKSSVTHIMFTRWLTLWSKSKTIVPTKPVMLPKEFPIWDGRYWALRKLSTMYYVKYYKESRRKRKKKSKRWKRYWKHTKKNYRKTY